MPEEATVNRAMCDVNLKLQAIDDFDRKVVGPLLRGLEGEEVRILLLPDHPTPLHLRSHTPDPVPYVLYDSRNQDQGSGRPYSEADAAATGIIEEHGHRLLSRLLNA